MLIKILLIGALLVGFLALVVSLRSSDYRVARSRRIAAPAAQLFAMANNHHRFVEWSPFQRLDPNLKMSFSGPEEGPGASCSWDGNREVGAGTVTIVDSRPFELVRQRMDSLRPMKGVATVEYTFKPDGDATVVTWTMYGKNGFVGKLFGLFVDCDKLCGAEFEKGLANLAALTEKQHSVR